MADENKSIIEIQFGEHLKSKGYTQEEIAEIIRKERKNIMSNEELIKAMDMIQWAEKKRKSNDEFGVKLSLTIPKEKGKSPRLKICFGEKCGEVVAAKYARYSRIVTDDGEVPEFIFFEFSAEKKTGPSWYKVCKGCYIEPALSKDEIEAFNEVWAKPYDYDLEYNYTLNRYYIKAKGAR